jgi:2-dehydropantoate 2-reductase
VVTLQNGVDSVAVLSRVLGPDAVIGGAAHIASTIAAPGLIRHTGTLARLQLGELDGGHSERVAALSQALDQAGVDHQVSDDIARDIWAKMVFLATFSGLTALTRLPIGRVREDPDTRALYEAGLTEALAVAHARGIALPADFVARTLARTDQLPAEMRSSLLHDLAGGRRLELPWLSGAIVRLGRELGIATPTHAFIATALKLHAGGA